MKETIRGNLGSWQVWPKEAEHSPDGCVTQSTSFGEKPYAFCISLAHRHTDSAHHYSLAAHRARVMRADQSSGDLNG